MYRAKKKMMDKINILREQKKLQESTARTPLFGEPGYYLYILDSIKLKEVNRALK